MHSSTSRRLPRRRLWHLRSTDRLQPSPSRWTKCTSTMMPRQPRAASVSPTPSTRSSSCPPSYSLAAQGTSASRHCLMAMSINATTLLRKGLLLGRVQRLLHGLHRVEQAKRSGASSMDKSLVPLSAAAHALIAPTVGAAALAPSRTPLPRLLSSVIRTSKSRWRPTPTVSASCNSQPVVAMLPSRRFERFSVSVQATTLPRKQLLLGRVQRLIHGLDRVEQVYRGADSSMPKKLSPLPAAAHALVAHDTNAAALASLATVFTSASTHQ